MDTRRIFRIFSLFCILMSFLFSPSTQQLASATSANTLSLNGTSWLQIPDDRLLNPPTQITLEAWVRLTTDIMECMTIAGKNYSTSYWLGLCDRSPRFYSGGWTTAFSASSMIPVGEWTHLAATYDGSIGKIYINGRQVAFSASTHSLPGNTGPLQIGADNGNYPFTGMVADVRLWSVARTMAEIRADMVRLPSTRQVNLWGAWNLEGGGGEVFDRTNAEEVNSPSWTGGAAPAFLYDPILVPRLAGAPSNMYSCSPSDYNGALRVPIWYWEGHYLPNPVWVNVGATATDIYVCMENVDLNADFSGLYFDLDNSGGILAHPHDYSLRILYPSGENQTLAGNGVGNYTSAILPGWSGVLDYDEFTATYAYRVPRSAISSTDGRFRLGFIHHWIGGVGNDYGWPTSMIWNSPNSWPAFLVNDGSIPPPDNKNPRVEVLHSPSPTVRAGQPLNITALAEDDTDIAQVNILVDGTVRKSCSYPEIPDSTGTCDYSYNPVAGMHSYYAHVIDQRGRSGYSPLTSFFAQIDGRAPQLNLSYAPRRPLLRQSFIATVTATDPSGISRLEVGSDSYPVYTVCPVSPGTTTTCNITFNPGNREVIRFWATAEDNEHQTVASNRRTVLMGNQVTGETPDQDNDGIVDMLELLLGTNPLNPDSDHDSLLDGWEVLGIQFFGSRTDLPGLGANPLRRDVFVQYDYELGAHVGANTWEIAIGMFRSNGINLWMKQNERSRTGVISTRDAEDACYQDDGTGNYYFDPDLSWTHHYIYSRHFAGASGAYHHMTVDVNTGNDCPMSSIDPQNDPDCRPHDINNHHIARDYYDLIYRVVHEIGHNLGMGHGGREGDKAQNRRGDVVMYGLAGDEDDMNQKPNYLSMMSYHYNVFGGPICYNASGDMHAEYDFDHAYLPSLDEEHLNETSQSIHTALAGFSCPEGFHAAITYSCVTPSGDHQLRATDGNQVISVQSQYGGWAAPGPGTLVTGGIDWDCDNSLEADVTANLNGDGGRDVFGSGSDTDFLTSQHDWNGIPYRSGSGCYMMHDAGLSAKIPTTYLSAIGDPTCNVGVPGTLRLETSLGFNEEPIPVPKPHYEDDIELSMLPNLEACNGMDDDSDLTIDEDCPDEDLDGIVDALDNCPQIWNFDQADLDGSSLGDACQDPQVSDLSATFDGLAYTLAWNGSSADILGFNIYRQCFPEGTPRLLQVYPGDFPTTTGYDFKDGPGTDYCSYCVSAVNLVGGESGTQCVRSLPVFLPVVIRE